jgi:hypothetical protein
LTARLETGAARAWERLLSRTGGLVTLKRGSLTTSDVRAITGNTLLKVTTDEGPRTIRTDKDFLILAEEYLIDGEAVEPVRADRITTAGGVIYELLPYGDEDIYRWSDEYHIGYRIHTKRIS